MLNNTMMFRSFFIQVCTFIAKQLVTELDKKSSV